MSHVAEGALHAYLDGALDEFPAAEAERIRLHLETCRQCSEELEVARRLRADAMTILGLAAPVVALPTLEELRAVEKQRRPATPPRRAGLRSLGWAASIAVAVGAGWLLREGQLRQVEPSPLAPSVAVETGTPRTDSSVPLLAERGEPVAPPEGDGAGARGGTEPSPSPSLREGSVDGSRRMALGDRASSTPAQTSATQAPRRDDPAGETVLTEALDAPAALTAGRAAGARRVATAPVTRVGVAAVPFPMETVPSVEPPASSRDRSGTLVPVASASAVDGSGIRRRRELSDDDLPRDKAVALAVPGYDVVSITNLGNGTTSLGVHVEQRLHDAVTFDVFHLESGVEPGVLTPAPVGVVDMRVETEEGWVVIRGQLDDATLSELLTRLFPG